MKNMLQGSDDPFSIISLVGDTGSFQLSNEIAAFFQHSDPMVRWNAVSVLLGRFRDVNYAMHALNMLHNENDTMVISAILMGIGEILPLVSQSELQSRLASILYVTYTEVNAFPETREAAYHGIEAAVGLPTLRAIYTPS